MQRFYTRKVFMWSGCANISFPDAHCKHEVHWSFNKRHIRVLCTYFIDSPLNIVTFQWHFQFKTTVMQATTLKISGNKTAANVKTVLWPDSPRGPRPPNYRGFIITIRHNKLGWTPLDEWSACRRDVYLTTHHSEEGDVHAPGGIRTRNPSKWTAADPRPRPYSYCDRRSFEDTSVTTCICKRYCHLA
jgi:hypothetical protein